MVRYQCCTERAGAAALADDVLAARLYQRPTRSRRKAGVRTIQTASPAPGAGARARMPSELDVAHLARIGGVPRTERIETLYVQHGARLEEGAGDWKSPALEQRGGGQALGDGRAGMGLGGRGDGQARRSSVPA